MSTQPAQLQKIIYFSACREQKYNFFQTILANNALKSRKLYKFVASNPYNTLYIMSQETHNKAEYIVIFISEFARHYGLSAVQAYRYLNRYKAIDFLDEQYNIAHTQSFEDMVQNMAGYCQRYGGALI